MIKTNSNKALPEWTDQACRDLFEHARELGQNGNTSGFFLTLDWYPFVGEQEEHDSPGVKPENQWDYDRIRRWINCHTESVQRVWQDEVVEFW